MLMLNIFLRKKKISYSRGFIYLKFLVLNIELTRSWTNIKPFWVILIENLINFKFKYILD